MEQHQDATRAGAAAGLRRPGCALVLGATGLLGSAVYRALSEGGPDASGAPLAVAGTIRDGGARRFFAPPLADGLRVVGDLQDAGELDRLLDAVGPSVVINCLSLARAAWSEPLRLFAMLSVLPRRLAAVCRRRGIRLVQIGSDGVFSGSGGGYTEDDLPDATDAYGMAKILGEVDGSGAITLRTSVIGHELASQDALLEWFLSQEGECRGFTKALYSGLPAIELARVLRDVVLPRPDLEGVYHVAGAPISKFDLLALVGEVYGARARLVPDESVALDRSLSADRFRRETGYSAPPWRDLVARMHEDHVRRRAELAPSDPALGG